MDKNLDVSCISAPFVDSHNKVAITQEQLSAMAWAGEGFTIFHNVALTSIKLNEPEIASSHRSS